MNRIHEMSPPPTSIEDYAPGTRVVRVIGDKDCPSGTEGIITDSKPPSIVWMNNGHIQKSMIDARPINIFIGNVPYSAIIKTTSGLYGVVVERFYDDGEALVVWLNNDHASYDKCNRAYLESTSVQKLSPGSELRLVCNLPDNKEQ